MRTAGSIARAALRRLWSRTELRVYAFPASRLAELPEPALPLRRDGWDDLALYTQTSAHHQLEAAAFAALVEERRAQGFHVYTAVERGTLVHYAWLIDRQAEGDDAALGMRLFRDPPCAVTLDAYTHPSARRRGWQRASLARRIRDGITLAGAPEVQMQVRASNRPSLAVVEALGCEYVGSLFREVRLGASRSFATGPRIRAVPLANAGPR